MLPTSWADEFFAAFASHVEKYRQTEGGLLVPIDYGSSHKGVVSGSGLVACVRQKWYEAHDIAGDDTPDNYRFTAEQGRFMEVPVVAALREMGYLVEPQRYVGGKHIGGTLDGVITGREFQDNKLAFESKHLGALRYLSMFYEPLIESHRDYFWQYNAYGKAAREEGLELQAAFFVVTSQDASAVRTELYNRRRRKQLTPEMPEPDPKAFAFVIEYLPEDVMKVIDKRAKAMRKALKGEEPPARERDIAKDWQCGPRFCPWRSQCFDDGPYGDEIYQLPDHEIEVEQVWAI